MGPRARVSRCKTSAPCALSRGSSKVRTSSGLPGNAPQREPQIREKGLKFGGSVSIPGIEKPGEPHVAVNLNGIDLSGTAASSAQKASSKQSAPASSQD